MTPQWYCDIYIVGHINGCVVFEQSVKGSDNEKGSDSEQS